ncbi:MAG TPA: hypothetical protein VFL42_15260, partial [Terriglobales bacterium]|nr:hypothetical protein [Terriglobales bacterium]
GKPPNLPVQLVLQAARDERSFAAPTRYNASRTLTMAAKKKARNVWSPWQKREAWCIRPSGV